MLYLMGEKFFDTIMGVFHNNCEYTCINYAFLLCAYWFE